jgi:eukaryotic-like serine/threonine-protein kinase
MDMSAKLEQLLEHWEDLRQAGREVSAEELCQKYPDLLKPLKQRIVALKSMDWLTKDSHSNEDECDDVWQELPHTLGRYRLDELVGTGGFGQVWKGFDPELQRTVAIKVPRPDRIASWDQLDKFLEEARKVAQLKHPGIVPVYDVCQDGDWLFIVSDFIDGGNLADRIAQARPDWRESVRLIAEVAAILQYAHDQSFIHRDIKPANILLDSHGKTYLADFGIAISGNHEKSSGTDTAGTLPYMSPEQVSEGLGRIDLRADIYGLGVVLYELLTSRKPFTADNPIDLRSAILSQQPTPPRTINTSIPVELDRICLKVLAKEPGNRYQTAADFATALRNAATPQRTLRTVWIAGLVVLVAGIIFGLVTYHKQPPQISEPSRLVTPSQASQSSTATKGSNESLASKPTYPNDAVPFNGHHYKVFWGRMSWHDAVVACKAMGGHLAIIETHDEKEFLAKLKSHDKAVWVGASRQDGTWKWLDGNKISQVMTDLPPLDYAAFAKGSGLNARQPNGLRPGGAIRWIQGYICEWDR